MNKMNNMKKMIAVIAVAGVLGTAGAAYAAAVKTPADIAAALTGKTIEAVNEERAGGKTYGTIANDAGKLDEFKAQMLEQKKAILDQKVKDGDLTQAQADEIYNNIKERQATCDGTGSAMNGRKNGTGIGQASGTGRGRGLGRSAGAGLGTGLGMGSGICGGITN